MDNLYPNYKKDDGNGIKPPGEHTDFLRSSVSNNQIKRIDKDFLRKTAYTPNNSKTFNISDRTEEHPQPHIPDQGSNGSSMFHKKVMEAESPDKKVPSSAFFKSLYQQEERPSLNKRPPSQVVCGFYLGKQLGVGKFGEVYLAKYTSTNARHIASGFVCALKKIVKAKVKEYNMMNQLIQEIKIQAFLNHPNIVQFYSVVSDEHNIYLVLEYMEGGTLFDYMNTK